VDQEVQQNKCCEVQFTAKITEKDKKGKWYLRNAATLKVFIISEAKGMNIL
jgi:hypothetical protein